MKFNIKITSVLIMLGLILQLGLVYAYTNDWGATMISAFFSAIVGWASMLVNIQKKKLLAKVEDQHYSDMDLLQKEVQRLQAFNKKNITTIKKLKVYSRSAMKQLKETSVDFMNTAQSMDNAIVLTDNDARVTWVNRAAEELYGFSSRMLKGEEITKLLTLPQGTTFDQIVGNLGNGEHEVEVQIKRNTVSDVWVHSHFSFQKNRKGDVTGIMILQMNLTDIKSNEEELRESLQRAQFAEKELKQFVDKQLETNEQLMITQTQLKTVLEKEKESKAVMNQTLSALKDTQGQLVHSEKMASLGQLTAGIAHEINNPINFIYNGIESLKTSLTELSLILDKYNELETNFTQELLQEIKDLKEELEYDFLREDLSEMLVDVKEGAVRTIEIVKGLRVFSRLDEESQKEASINECLDATIILLNNKLKNNISLKKELDPELPIVMCYPGQLNQVFMNMISNAIQAFRDDQPDCVITVSTIQDDNNIKIMIADNGIGMSEQVKNRIFEPFYTTKPVGVGTGLGLSISFGIIEKHHGNIEIESQEGQGTKFIISIPKEAEYAKASGYND